jgi:hypothetical protein
MFHPYIGISGTPGHSPKIQVKCTKKPVSRGIR